MQTRTVSRLAALALWAVPAVGSAQVFGTFAWQMQPYCNVVTLTLTRTPAGFTLDGADDQCGATNRGSALGVATFNTAGSVTLNFTIVTPPGGRPVHVSAVVSPANGNGIWADSVGNSGTLAFSTSAPGLPERPFPSSGLPPAVITTVEIAAGAVGSSDVNPAEVQLRVTGSCSSGEAVTGVNPNGSVSCSTSVRFRAQDVVEQTLTGSDTLTFATLIYNVGGGTYDAAAGTYVVPVSGTYLLTASALFLPPAVVSEYYCLALNVNGGDTQFTCAAQTGSDFEVPNLSTVRELTAGQVIKVRAFNNSGGSQVISGGFATSDFTVTRLQ